MYPSTTMGKVIASFCAVIGIMMLALPLGVISNNFNAFEKYSIRFQKIMDSLTPPINEHPDIVVEKRKSEVDTIYNQDSKTKMLQ
jgi:hypothetical protein